MTLAATPLPAPGPHAPPGATFSQALRVGDELIISGVTAGAAARAQPMDAQAQALACLGQIEALVRSAGGSMDNVLKLVVYLTDIADREAVNAARRALFTPPYPASTLVGVKALVFPELVVEIDATIRLDARRQAATAPPDQPDT